MLSGNTQWQVMSTFWHKMNLKPVCSIKMWKLTEKSYFCALSVTFLRLGCLLKLECLLQGYVTWKYTMTFNWQVMSTFWHKMSNLKPVCSIKMWKLTTSRLSTFWHKMSGLGLVISNLYGDIDRKIIFLCPLRYIFEARVPFKVGMSPSRLC